MQLSTLIVRAPILGITLIFSTSAFYASPSQAKNQPKMRAALDHLYAAEQKLQTATRDKGGHRAKALEHVRRAIAEVKKGFKYDNRH